MTCDVATAARHAISFRPPASARFSAFAALVNFMMPRIHTRARRRRAVKGFREPATLTFQAHSATPTIPRFASVSGQYLARHTLISFSDAFELFASKSEFSATCHRCGSSRRFYIYIFAHFYDGARALILFFLPAHERQVVNVAARFIFPLKNRPFCAIDRFRRPKRLEDGLFHYYLCHACFFYNAELFRRAPKNLSRRHFDLGFAPSATRSGAGFWRPPLGRLYATLASGN